MQTARLISNTDIIFLLQSHPEFEWKESISSYIMRLAAANGYRSLKVFMQQLFNTRKSLGSAYFLPIRRDFFPPEGFGNLMEFTGYTSDSLLATTFSHLADTLLGQHDYFPTYKWLKIYLGTSFSFCPQCVQQYGYYSLAWRFTGNPGCPEHGIRLVTRCYLCDSPLPLPLGYDNARIGECPLCGGDLTHAPAKSLDYDSYEKALEFDNRISLLLLPHKDVSRKPIFETTRNKNIAISSSIFRVNWDTDLPEQREYATFSNYYEKKLISKNNFCVRLLFTLYWLSTSQTEAMLSYLAFRDDPRFLFRGIEETKPYLLGKKMYCRKITKANGTLPSEFDLVPIDPNLSQLWGIIFDMRTTLQELPMEVFYDKSIYEKVIEILISKLSRWVNQIDMLRSSKAEKKDSLDTKHMGIPKLKLRLLAIGNRSFNLKELSEFLFEIRLYVNTLAYDLYHNPELFKFTVEEMFMDLSKLISQIKTQNSSLIFLEEENRRQ